MGQSKTEEAKGPSQKEQNKTKDRATVQRGGRSSSTEKEELQLCNRFDALCDSQMTAVSNEIYKVYYLLIPRARRYFSPCYLTQFKPLG
ncbi:hypothetical protein F2Q68_00045709 [Brassica cretica]|uniref:Uncharacterized protein n=1 Tax=Brassica cretica TaxID=69181 RepID=A0A8S9LKF6_BRACR|nr:hypothetical protein F2Q68_00045709 [Brassica cretica]